MPEGERGYGCNVLIYGTDLTAKDAKIAAKKCKGDFNSCPFFNGEERRKVIHEMASHAEIALYNFAVKNIERIGEGNISNLITKK